MIVLRACLAVFVNHIIGGVNYAAVNILYDSPMDWKSVSGKAPKFKKVIFVALLSFVSNWFVMSPFLYLSYRRYRSALNQAAEPHCSPFSPRAFILLLLPAIFQFVAVCISLTGSKYILASLVVGIKATRIFLSAGLSIKFLGKRYFAYQWLAMLLVVPGVVCIGAAAELNKSKQSDYSQDWYLPYLGMTCVFASEFLRSAKGVYEEKMLKQIQLSPIFVAVVEGLMCSLLAAAGLFIFHFAPGHESDSVGEAVSPGQGSVENFWNTIEWIGNSHRVQFWVVWLLCTTGFITYAGFLVI